MTLYRGNPLLAGIATLVVIGAVVLLAVGINTSFGLPGDYGLGLPPTRDYTLRATFDDANGLLKGASVEVAGVPVGQVTDVSASGRRAVVGMRIDHQYAPLHTGTIAQIRYSTLLAQKYVELSPAANTKPLADGATIPSDETITPVDFDQFLSTLDPQTRQQAQVLVQQLGGGVQGQAETLNLLLDQLSGLAGDSQGGLNTVDAHAADLGSITANLATTSQRLADSRQQLGDLVANTASVTGTLTTNDRSLDDLLVRLAATSQDIDQTLDGNEGNLHDTITTLDPLLIGLNDNLATTFPYLHNNQGELKSAFDQLIPEIGSAIAQRDASGNFLRQYIVLDTCVDQRSAARANPTTGANCLANVSLSGPAPAPGSHAPPAAPPPTVGGTSGGSSGGAGKPTPSPSPCSSGPLPLPLPSLPPILPSPLPQLICPSPPPCVPPSPSPAPAPSPSPSPSPGCTGIVNGVTQSLPAPLPSAVGALLGLP